MLASKCVWKALHGFLNLIFVYLGLFLGSYGSSYGCIYISLDLVLGSLKSRYQALSMVDTRRVFHRFCVHSFACWKKFRYVTSVIYCGSVSYHYLVTNWVICLVGVFGYGCFYALLSNGAPDYPVIIWAGILVSFLSEGMVYFPCSFFFWLSPSSPRLVTGYNRILYIIGYYRL